MDRSRLWRWALVAGACGLGAWWIWQGHIQSTRRRAWLAIQGQAWGQAMATPGLALPWLAQLPRNKKDVEARRLGLLAAADAMRAAWSPLDAALLDLPEDPYFTSARDSVQWLASCADSTQSLARLDPRSQGPLSGMTRQALIAEWKDAVRCIRWQASTAGKDLDLDAAGMAKVQALEAALDKDH